MEYVRFQDSWDRIPMQILLTLMHFHQAYFLFAQFFLVIPQILPHYSLFHNYNVQCGSVFGFLPAFQSLLAKQMDGDRLTI